MQQSRRTFIKKSVALAGLASTFAISGTRASGQILGANDRLRVGVVGINGRGQSHISAFGGMPNVEVAYLIDVDSLLLPKLAAQVENAHGYKPNTVQDIRKALEDKELNAISIATCNHTHSLNAIWAMQAGKDVYVEKPCSHNIFEGRKCVEAADKYKRIVQHGTQSRLSAGRTRMVAAAKSGKYGTLKIAKGYCCKPRWTISYKPVKTPPETLDWDLWLGPASMQPFHENLVHYNWHWFWDTGNADAGNQGVHEYDLCRWMTGKTLPNNVLSFGARYVNEPEKGFKDQGETPNQMLTVHDYGDVKILFETRGLVGNEAAWKDKKVLWKDIVDVVLYTDQGVIEGDSFTPYDSDQKVKLEAVESPAQTCSKISSMPFEPMIAANCMLIFPKGISRPHFAISGTSRTGLAKRRPSIRSRRRSETIRSLRRRSTMSCKTRPTHCPASPTRNLRWDRSWRSTRRRKNSSTTPPPTNC